MNPYRPRRIRIVEAGWETYSGHVGTVMFDNATSVDPVSFQEQQIIGGLLRVESMDEGEEGSQVGPAAELVRSRDIDADHERVAATSQGVPVGEHGDVRLAVERFTQTELEDIADRRGIGGLRDIAAPYDVKGRSITDLISGILKAQMKGEPAPGEAVPVETAPAPVDDAEPASDEAAPVEVEATPATETEQADAPVDLPE